MKKNFWGTIKSPIVGLSPMDGVTDAACRYIAKKYGGPDVIYTEFVSAEGLWRIKKRGETDHKIWRDLRYSEEERPIVAQLFGSDPDSFYQAAVIVAEMGFDGVDINMGCPSKGLEKREGGAGLMRNQSRAEEIIEATRRGVIDTGKLIPVSVKTRTGSATPDPEWWDFLASQRLPVVAMHGRTFRQLYSGDADWDVLERAAEVIRESGALFLANGDVNKMKVLSKTEGEVSSSAISRDDMGGSDSKVVLSTGIERSINNFDGVLIGRAMVGDPWCLRKDGYETTIREKLEIAVEHAKQYELSFPGEKLFPVRKHLVKYVTGFDGCVDLRKKLVMTESANEVEAVVDDFLHNKGH